MRYLILPDVHDKIRRANQIIEREPHDHLLLMGDFFDDFRTGVTDAADTAHQVKWWLNAPNITCLLGNHDMSYGWGRQNRRLICPGYDQAKWITIHGSLTSRDWQKFKLHAWLDSGERPWLVSHAGLHPCWLEGAEPGNHREFIDKLSADAWDSLNRGEHHFLLSRSGDQNIGGINWMDWDELVPVPGLNQLVGTYASPSGSAQEPADQPEHLSGYEPAPLCRLHGRLVGDQELRRPDGRRRGQIAPLFPLKYRQP
jgi:hypothetical protein